MFSVHMYTIERQFVLVITNKYMLLGNLKSYLFSWQPNPKNLHHTVDFTFVQIFLYFKENEFKTFWQNYKNRHSYIHIYIPGGKIWKRSVQLKFYIFGSITTYFTLNKLFTLYLLRDFCFVIFWTGALYNSKYDFVFKEDVKRFYKVWILGIK